MALEQASPEVQLAVDLIYLLECNEISPAIALAALEIVKHDLQGKLKKQPQQSEE
ncbi:pleiotropic regulatory protein RsmS [Xenorhabdus taiwanensis]|uniref:Pleiotropic regulatory protein RsmS n=1 Tax=Xenorhabdus taiwanensis TaxID=3085177 RepID=A0ABN7BZP2_9GAMM|nr:pleiotropic regulatory protein RsmS [Xenorhabdus sp. TCT-1]